MHVGIHFPGGGGGHYMHALVQLLLGAELPSNFKIHSTGHAHKIPHRMKFAIDTTDSTIERDRSKLDFVKEVIKLDSGLDYSVYCSHIRSEDLKQLSTELAGSKNVIIHSEDYVDYVEMSVRQFYKTMSSATDVPDGPKVWQDKLWTMDTDPSRIHTMERLGIFVEDLSLDPHKVGGIKLLLWAMCFQAAIPRYTQATGVDYSYFNIAYRDITNPRDLRRLASYLGVTDEDRITQALRFARDYRDNQTTLMDIIGEHECI